MSLWKRWDASNQRRAKRDDVRVGGEDWAARLDRDTPGPRWAWAISGIPLLHWIGDAAIAISTGRRRRGPKSR